MYCLDTYALVEIKRGNPSFAWLLNEKFILSELTLCEFFSVLYKEEGLDEASKWTKKLEPFAVHTTLKILNEAMKFRIDEKKKNLSFFDAAGYFTAINENTLFVTGDKEFKNMPDVKFIK